MAPVRSAVAVEDALILLRTGRARMAERHLEGSADRIRRAIEDARSEGRRRGCGSGMEHAAQDSWRDGYGKGLEAGTAAGHEEGKREGIAEALRATSAPPPGTTDPPRLARMCAEPAGRALAACAPKVRDRDLDAIIAGRVKLTPARWKRLRAAVDGGDRKEGAG